MLLVDGDSKSSIVIHYDGFKVSYVFFFFKSDVFIGIILN